MSFGFYFGFLTLKLMYLSKLISETKILFNRINIREFSVSRAYLLINCTTILELYPKGLLTSMLRIYKKKILKISCFSLI
jgi:hypothetical protein